MIMQLPQAGLPASGVKKAQALQGFAGSGETLA
jgi:hypothetical protein